MAEEIAFENGKISNSEGLMTLSLTLDQVTMHTVVYHSSTSTYMLNFTEINTTFCGRTDGFTDRQLRLALLDLKNNAVSRTSIKLVTIELCWVVKLLTAAEYLKVKPICPTEHDNDTLYHKVCFNSHKPSCHSGMACTCPPVRLPP